MPRYIDQHPTPPLSPETIDMVRRRLTSGGADEFGEKGMNVFVGTTKTFCYTEAPDAEAVRKSHEAMGILIGPEDITEVQVLP